MEKEETSFRETGACPYVAIPCGGNCTAETFKAEFRLQVSVAVVTVFIFTARTLGSQ
jgi:hypothetical protein